MRAWTPAARLCFRLDTVVSLSKLQISLGSLLSFLGPGLRGTVTGLGWGVRARLKGN